MAPVIMSKFIAFQNYVNPEKKNILKSELISLTAELSVESNNALKYALSNDSESVKLSITQLKQKIELLFNQLSSIDPPSKPEEPPSVIYHTSVNENSKKISDRELDNGGMAPPKAWKSITELNLKSSEKSVIIEEMRRLKEQGKTVIKSHFHSRLPISIEEFTQPFSYLENVKDYNGSFLITLLRSKLEISNAASTFQIDLKHEEEACANGEKIILLACDIMSSMSHGEEKKFIIILNFDKLNGTLKYSHAIFSNGKQLNLSNRQLNEVHQFCTKKKINQ